MNSLNFKNPIAIGNTSTEFSTKHADRTGLYGEIYDFTVDYEAAEIPKIYDIHRYLMKKHDIV